MAKVAEIVALVFSTLQGLVATQETHMNPVGVWPSFLDGAANLLTLMPLAALHLIADLLTIEYFCCLELVFLKDFMLQILRVVRDVARHCPLVLPAHTILADQNFAHLASIGVASLLALMQSTGKELLTEMIASWNRVQATLSLPANQRFNRIVTARAIFQALRIFGTWATFTFVTSLLTCMVSTLKRKSADLVALHSWVSTYHLSCFLPAEAGLGYFYVTRIAVAFVALLLTLVNQAVQELAAFVFANEF